MTWTTQSLNHNWTGTMANTTYPWLGCTQSNKSSQWSLMDLVHMASCSIRWANTCYSTEPTKINQKHRVDIDIDGLWANPNWCIIHTVAQLESRVTWWAEVYRNPCWSLKACSSENLCWLWFLWRRVCIFCSDADVFSGLDFKAAVTSLTGVGMYFRV